MTTMAFRRYEIGVADVLRECKSSDQFMRRLGSGRYTYVEKHICLNRPKYIDWSRTIATLTPYAREHKDECCLQFVTTAIDYTPSDHGKNVFYLIPAPTFTDPEYNDQPEKVYEHMLQFAGDLKAVQALAEELPNNFPKMLDKLIANSGVKEETLAGVANLSEKTIQRLRHHEQKSIGIDTVVQLCCASVCICTLS